MSHFEDIRALRVQIITLLDNVENYKKKEKTMSSLEKENKEEEFKKIVDNVLNRINLVKSQTTISTEQEKLIRDIFEKINTIYPNLIPADEIDTELTPKTPDIAIKNTDKRFKRPK